MTRTVEAELEQFTQGDIQAFEILFREYQGQVYGWIVRVVRDPGAAEDLTLETFWRIYRARARLVLTGLRPSVATLASSVRCVL